MSKIGSLWSTLVLLLLISVTTTEVSAFNLHRYRRSPSTRQQQQQQLLPTINRRSNHSPKVTFRKTAAASTSTLLEASSSSSSSSADSSDEVVIDRDFRLAGIFLVAGLLLDTLPYLGFGLGLFVTALGILFLVQTFRLRFVCDETSFSLQNTVKESGENILVGGQNKWPYDVFVNYDFFPEGWIDQPQGPILVYFKERQTPSDKWNDGPGALANSEEALSKGAIPGQVHFFPCLVNAKQLQAEWKRRGCQKL